MIESALGLFEIAGQVTTTFAAINAGIAGALSGAVTGGSKGALLGLLQAELFFGAGSLLQSIATPSLGLQTAEAFVAHGLVG